MVDVIGWKAAASVARVAPTAPVRAAKSGDAPKATAPAAPPSLASELAAAPPVDMERVAQIKAAIASGDFPILPSTVADRLLALRLQWNPNDKA